MRRMSLTYGVMPDYLSFMAAFYAECPDGIYEVRNCKLVGNSLYTCQELYEQCRNYSPEEPTSDEEENDWVSRVLERLGIEWVLSSNLWGHSPLVSG
jgi:hypothetical protein